MELSVKFDAQRIIRRMNEIPDKIVAEALPVAINKTMDKARTALVKEMSAKSGIQQKLIRARTSIRRASRFKLSGRFYFGVLPIRSGKIGTPRQTKTGARVGRFNFPGAFKATMPSGHVAAFKRKGHARLPIREETIDLVDAGVIARRNFHMAVQSDFSRLFQHELQYRLNKRGK